MYYYYYFIFHFYIQRVYEYKYSEYVIPVLFSFFLEIHLPVLWFLRRKYSLEFPFTENESTLAIYPLAILCLIYFNYKKRHIKIIRRMEQKSRLIKIFMLCVLFIHLMILFSFFYMTANWGNIEDVNN